MRKTIKKIFGIIIILIGLLIFAYPTFMEWQLNQETNETIKEFQDKYYSMTINEAGDSDEATEEAVPAEDKDALYEALLEYNQNLIDNGQQLVDAWSYQEEPLDLESLGLDDAVIGYIEIPDMDVTLSLYLGASLDNLASGAAVMSQTSMPIGGASTNCVIAGHRGYRGIPYFRNIELLEIGSMVYITNPWETLYYKVVEIEIIKPNDVDAILIQEGRDLVTLITCHPYMSGGKYRYVVYCERTDEYGNIISYDKTSESESAGTPYKITTGGDLVEIESSSGLIETEKIIRIIAFITILVCLVILFKPKRKNKKKDKEKQE